MAGRPVEEALLVPVIGPVLGAHRIVGAEPPVVERGAQVLPQVTPDLDEAAERPLRVRRPRVEQDARARRRDVDTLADRARRVAARERRRRDEEVRQRVEQDVPRPGEEHLHPGVRRAPRVEPVAQRTHPLLHRGARDPCVDGRRIEGQEHALAAVLNRRHPRHLTGE